MERVFGVLENDGNGDPLGTVSQALGLAEGMTYKGVHSRVTLIETPYAKGGVAQHKADETLQRACSDSPGWVNGSSPSRPPQPASPVQPEALK